MGGYVDDVEAHGVDYAHAKARRFATLGYPLREKSTVYNVTPVAVVTDPVPRLNYSSNADPRAKNFHNPLPPAATLDPSPLPSAAALDASPLPPAATPDVAGLQVPC